MHGLHDIGKRLELLKPGKLLRPTKNVFINVLFNQSSWHTDALVVTEPFLILEILEKTKQGVLMSILVNGKKLVFRLAYYQVKHLEEMIEQEEDDSGQCSD